MTSKGPSVAETSPEVKVHPKVRHELSTKILVGVGSTDTYVPALDLLAGLRFQEPQITLLHAVDTTCPIVNADAKTEIEYAKVVENIGMRILERAKGEAHIRSLSVKIEMVFGRAADSMITKANKDSSEIIALCAVRHGAWSTGYMGSATCALALNANQSLLIGKTPLAHPRPLRAVLGIDHSSKTADLLQNLLDLGPQGVKEILVVSAYETDDETSLAANQNLPMLGADIDRSLKETFTEKNEKLVDLLVKSGYEASSRVVSGPPTDVLREAMKEFRADLLIIGATGNGSPAGAKIGSVALHEIIAEPYSVLMLRG